MSTIFQGKTSLHPSSPPTLFPHLFTSPHFVSTSLLAPSFLTAATSSFLDLTPMIITRPQSMSESTPQKRPLDEIPTNNHEHLTNPSAPAPTSTKRLRTTGFEDNYNNDDELCQLGPAPIESCDDLPIFDTPVPPPSISFNLSAIYMPMLSSQLETEFNTTNSKAIDFFPNSLTPTILERNEPLSEAQLSFLLSHPQPTSANLYHRSLDSIKSDLPHPLPTHIQPTMQHKSNSKSAQHLTKIQEEFTESQIDQKCLGAYITAISSTCPIDPILFPAHLNPHFTKQLLPRDKEQYQQTDEFRAALEAQKLNLTTTLRQIGPVPDQLMKIYAQTTEATGNYQLSLFSQQLLTLLSKRIQQHDSLVSLRESIKELAEEYTLVQQRLKSVNNINSFLEDLSEKMSLSLSDIMHVPVEPNRSILQLHHTHHNFNPLFHIIPHLPDHPRPPQSSQPQDLKYDPSCCDGHVITTSRLIKRPKQNPFTIYTATRNPRVLTPQVDSFTPSQDHHHHHHQQQQQQQQRHEDRIIGYLTPELAEGFLPNPRDQRDYSQFCINLDDSEDCNSTAMTTAIPDQPQAPNTHMFPALDAMGDKAIQFPRYSRVPFYDRIVFRPIVLRHNENDPNISFIVGKDDLIKLKATYQ